MKRKKNISSFYCGVNHFLDILTCGVYDMMEISVIGSQSVNVARLFICIQTIMRLKMLLVQENVWFTLSLR